MARTVGSKNKKKELKTYDFVDLKRQIQGTAETSESPLGWVKWGSSNSYPDDLLSLYANSPTMASCVDFATQSIVGRGVDFEASQFDGNEVVPNYQYGWNDLLKRVAKDYVLFGMYAIEVIRNKDGVTNSYWHIPMHKVRFAKFDADGQILHFYVSPDWTTVSSNPPTVLDAFDMRPDSTIKKGVPYLFVYRPYCPLNDYYAQPRYTSALKAIQAEKEFIQFDLRSVVNSFVPTGLLTLQEVGTEEERRSIIDGIQKLFQGSNNANSLMISFQSNVDQPQPSFTPFTTSSESFNLFEDSNHRSINRILSSFRLNSPQLIGLQVENAGFNSEGKLLETAYRVYNETVGNEDRMAVVNTFNTMLSLNGIDTQLVIKELSFGDEESTPEIDSADYTDNNVEEKVE